MNEKPRELTSEELAAKRAVFDRVFAVANAERTEMISLYDIATWLLYVCTRSDAIDQAKELLEDDEPEWENYSTRDEIDNNIDAALDDSDSAISHELDIKTLGEQLDPDFDKPAHELEDWLDDVYKRKSDPESADVLRRVVDNAIDSSRRAAARKPEK